MRIVIRILIWTITLMSSLAFSSFGKEVKTISFIKALKDKHISIIELCSNGGASGKALYIGVRNNTKLPLKVKIDPALIFKPTEENYQPLVTVGEELITMKPAETVYEMLQTFCGNSGARSPKPNLEYQYFKQGNANFVSAAQYINKHKLFGGLGQRTVWMFTNNHSLKNVYERGTNETASKQLVAYLANITNQPIPEYFTVHKEAAQLTTPNAILFNPEIEKAFAIIEWEMDKYNRNVTVQILDSNKKFYRKVKNNISASSNGKCKMIVELNPSEDPTGTYYVQLLDNENFLIMEKTLQLNQKENCNYVYQ